MSEVDSTRVIPAHLAFYWLGVGKQLDGGAVAMGGEFGPYVECLAEHFAKVTVLVHEPAQKASSTEDVADYVARPTRGNIDVLSLGPKGTWRQYLATRMRVAATVRAASSKWDILVLRFGRRAHVVFGANRCSRIVTMVHGLWGSGAGAETASVKQRIAAIPLNVRARWHIRRVLRGSDVFVTDGEECLARYGRFAQKSKIIRLSVRRARWSYLAPDRLVGGEPRFLYVGQLSGKKGILEAIEAFAEVRSRLLPKAHLEVVGTGPDGDAAQALARRLGISESVTFHGWVPPGERLFTFYHGADVLLFLSRSTTESFPRVVSEALAHSVLVVGTRVGSLPIAFDSGKEMQFVTPRPQEVVEAVRQLVEDPQLRTAMIAHGRQWAKETSLEHISMALAEVISERWPELSTNTVR
jgi:glycosyltransferase involved in cell wall biosynthesis